jgi:hypothetical protein
LDAAIGRSGALAALHGGGRADCPRLDQNLSHRWCERSALRWRSSTIDVDLAIVSDDADDILRELPRLKEQLSINVELVAPSDFVPEVPGWRERSLFIRQIGAVAFLHYDFYSQALAKIERGHSNDTLDVAAMLERRLVEPAKLCELFDAIRPNLYRYPAIDVVAFGRALNMSLSPPDARSQ